MRSMLLFCATLISFAGSLVSNADEACLHAGVGAEPLCINFD